RGLLVRPRLHAFAWIYPGIREDLPGGRDADPVDVLDRHFPALVPRQVHSGDACHGRSFPSYPWRCLWRGVFSMMLTPPPRPPPPPRSPPPLPHRLPLLTLF